jgi:DNA-binding NarL/FixJ family response regulator
MPDANAIDLFLVDDHKLVRRGLRTVLAADPVITVVGEAADGLSAVAACRRLRPRVVVMDVSLPEMNGIDAARDITHSLPYTRVLMLSMHADALYVRQSLQAGARGYLLKDDGDRELIAGVKAVAEGRRYFSPTVEQLLVAAALEQVAAEPVRDQFWSLTGRERQVIQLIAEGRNTRQIARMLSVTPATVNAHRGATMTKLGLHNTAEIVRFAVRCGVVH